MRKCLRARKGGKKKADSYRWNSRRLASLPRTGSGPERHIDRGHTPWCSELLMRNTLFFLITDLALWRKKFKCSVAAAQQGVKDGKDRKQTHTRKQTNKPIKKNCSVYSSSLIFISFWSTLMFYLSVFSFLLVVFCYTLVLATLTPVLHVSEASKTEPTTSQIEPPLVPRVVGPTWRSHVVCYPHSPITRSRYFISVFGGRIKRNISQE